MSYNLVETSLVMIRDEIMSSISTHLAAVRALRTGDEVATPPLTKVYLFEKPVGPLAPFGVLICPRAEWPPENFVKGKLEVYASVVVEETDKERLVFKAWRYQAAMYALLHRLRLTSVDGSATMTALVTEAAFSPEYQNSEKENVFRREVMLKLEVNHWEKNA